MSTRQFGYIEQRTTTTGQARFKAIYRSPVDNRRISQTFPNITQAQTWLNNEHALVQAAQAGLATWVAPIERNKPAASNPLFHDWATKIYYEKLRTDTNGHPLAPATLRYKDLAFNRLDSQLGEKHLQSITTKTVRTMLANSQLPHVPLRTMYGLLKALMNEAVNPSDGSQPLLTRNPCTYNLPKSTQKSTIPPATPQEVATILTNMPGYTRISIYIAVALGLRIGEICALQLQDIDTRNATLHVRHSVRRGVGDVGPLQVDDTKTESSKADLPIPKTLMLKIQEHISKYCTTTNADAMLIQPKQSRVMNPNLIRKHFDNARAQAGRPDLHFHTLRATAISEIVHQGAEPKEVQAFGRHADVTVSLEHYQRARGAEKQRELAEKAYHALLGGPRTLADVNAEIETKMRTIRQLQDDIERLQQLRIHLTA